MIEAALLLLGAIGFIAYAVRGVTGAGSAIVFNALFGLALVFGLAGDLTLLDGLYWVALGDMLAVIVMAILLRDQLRLDRFVAWFLAFMVPVGVAFALLLPAFDLEVLAIGMGIVLVVSGIYLGLRQRLGVWTDDQLRRRAAPAGIGAGVLAGLYGMPGPVFLIYIAHAGEDTGVFRIRALVISGVMSVARALTLIASGAISSEALVRFGVTAPIVLLGLGAGLWLHPHIGPRAFRYGLGVIVVLSGVILVVQTAIG